MSLKGLNGQKLIILMEANPESFVIQTLRILFVLMQTDCKKCLLLEESNLLFPCTESVFITISHWDSFTNYFVML